MEQLISFKTAKLAKEKGFNWETENFYTNSRKPRLAKGLEYESDCFVRLWNWNEFPANYPTIEKEVLCAVPTQSSLQRWLREVYNIIVIPDLYGDDLNANNLLYQVTVDDYYNNPFPNIDGCYDFKKVNIKTYEEALEIGLYEALKLIKNGNNKIQTIN